MSTLNPRVFLEDINDWGSDAKIKEGDILVTPLFYVHEGGYDWSAFVVFNFKGTFYWSEDAGCSCNSPYEWATELSDFQHSASKSRVIEQFMLWDCYDLTDYDMRRYAEELEQKLDASRLGLI